MREVQDADKQRTRLLRRVPSAERAVPQGARRANKRAEPEAIQEKAGRELVLHVREACEKRDVQMRRMYAKAQRDKQEEQREEAGM